MYIVYYIWIYIYILTIMDSISITRYKKRIKGEKKMNVINAGSRYQIYGEDVKTYQKLPVGTYLVNFHPMQGFSLSIRNDLEVTEDKIYGNSMTKVMKVIRSYNTVNRNFGVLLSGQKGIGKSLFVRLLAEEGIKRGLPVITVTIAAPGIATFISSIEQDCVVIFDEFEKTFTITEDENQQDELLTLFDGMDGGHKLFVVTCNDLDHMSQYMLNRPGRFHYHFTMMPPTPEEVEEYMKDKLLPQYHHNIHDVVNLANIVDMPYDYLRAIAFELNQGYDLKEAMSDLNITRTDDARFEVTVFLSNGLRFEAWGAKLDMNSHKQDYIRVRRYEKDNFPHEFGFHFVPATAQIHGKDFMIKDKITQPYWGDYDFEGTDEECEKLAAEWNKNVTIEKIILHKEKDYGVARYLV